MQLYLLAFNVNTPIVKYAILLASAPVWWPFLRELWNEFNDILAEEGGLLGRTPPEHEIRRIRAEKARRESALVRELRNAKAFEPKRRPDMGGTPGFGAPRPGAARPSAAPGATGAPRKRGFGPPR